MSISLQVEPHLSVSQQAAYKTTRRKQPHCDGCQNFVILMAASEEHLSDLLPVLLQVVHHCFNLKLQQRKGKSGGCLDPLTVNRPIITLHGSPQAL